MIAGITDSYRSPTQGGRRDVIAAAIAAELPKADQEEVVRATIMMRHLIGARSCFFLTRDESLSSSEAAALCVRAGRAVIDDLRRGGGA